MEDFIISFIIVSFVLYLSYAIMKTLSEQANGDKTKENIYFLIYFLICAFIYFFCANVQTYGTDYDSTWSKLIESNEGEPVWETLTEEQQNLVNYPYLNEDEVFYVPDGKSYHSVDWCYTLENSKTILNCTLQNAIQKELEPCSKCVGHQAAANYGSSNSNDASKELTITPTIENQYMEYVYVTERGEFYHTNDCNFIKNCEDYGINKILLNEALKEGYAACDKCIILPPLPYEKGFN
jgi:hypothetical protein